MSEGWFETHQTVVHQWMCDRFGHLNVRFYAHIFDDAGFALWPLIGVTRAMFEEASIHTVIARTETDFKREILSGAVVAVRSKFEKIGNTSVTHLQEMRDVETADIHATQRTVEVFFDPDSRRAAEIPAAIRARVESLLNSS